MISSQARVALNRIAKREQHNTDIFVRKVANAVYPRMSEEQKRLTLSGVQLITTSRQRVGYNEKIESFFDGELVATLITERTDHPIKGGTKIISTMKIRWESKYMPETDITC